MKNFSNQNIIFAFIIFLSFFKVIISIETKEFILTSNSSSFFTSKNTNEDICISISFQLPEEQKSLLKDSVTYFHFIGLSENIQDTNNHQLYYSSTKSCPDISEAEQYTIKSSFSTDLFAKLPQNLDKIYLRIKCFKYPCSFSLDGGIEIEYAFLTDLMFHQSKSYSYFSNGNEMMKFKIPSSLDRRYGDDVKHVVTISVNKPDLNNINLYILNEARTKIEVDSIKTPTSKIFTFIEENIMINYQNNYLYALEIQSSENQFISLSIQYSQYIENKNKIESYLMPNFYSYYLNTKNVVANEECFLIDDISLNEELLNNGEDLLYASINYDSLPIKPFLKYNDEYKVPEDFYSNKNSINIIIEKKSDIFPQICFKTEDNNSLIFSLEISYISKIHSSIDIYNPLSSGFLYMKTLRKNTLAFYTHNSVNQNNQKISFILKILKGNPEMYIVSCDTYPYCYDNISQLKNDDKVIKPNLKDNSFYSYSKYTNGEKDLSPYGLKQDLLYVYCPDNIAEEYCQFETLIYSDMDIINLSPSDSFYSHLSKDESDLFKIHIPKNSTNLKKIKISIKSKQNMEFKLNEDNMNSKCKTKEEGKTYECSPLKTFSIYNQDYDLLFNIKANEDSDYSIKYKIVETDKIVEIQSFEFSKIEDIIVYSFPFNFYYILPNNLLDFKDYLFNFKFKASTALDETSSFKKIYINSTIINSQKLMELQSAESNINIFDENSLLFNKSFDLSTKTLSLNINKEYANTISNKIKNDDELVLYFSLDNYKNKNKNYNLEGQLFLFYENDKDFIIPYNTYINSKLPINKINFNLYHLQLNENKNKFVVDFSSNYELGENFKISFIDYDNNIENLKPENVIKNSSNINFITSNNKNKNKNSAIKQFEFNLKDNKKDVFLCVYSNVKDKNLTSINYIFKYNTYDDSEKRVVYEMNKKIKYSKSKDNKYFILEFDNIKKIKDDKSEYCKGEISVRAIKKNNKIKTEKIDSIALIQSDYKLKKGIISYQNGDKKITIKMEYNKIEKKYYSIFIDLPNENEKFVYDMIYIDKTGGKKKKKKTKNNLLWVVVITGSCVLLVVAIIVIIIVITRMKNEDLEEKVNAISFKKSGADAMIGQDNADDGDNDLLA